MPEAVTAGQSHGPPAQRHPSSSSVGMSYVCTARPPVFVSVSNSDWLPDGMSFLQIFLKQNMIVLSSCASLMSLLCAQEADYQDFCDWWCV